MTLSFLSQWDHALGKQLIWHINTVCPEIICFFQSWNSFLVNIIICSSQSISSCGKSLSGPWGLESGCVFVLSVGSGELKLLLPLTLPSHPFLGISLVTCTCFPLHVFSLSVYFCFYNEDHSQPVISEWKWFFMSLTEISVEGEAEKRFHTFQWSYHKCSVLVKLFRWRSSESHICSRCLATVLFLSRHFSWMSRFRMGESSLHSAANVLIVCILRQKYSHSPYSQSELHIQGKNQCWPCGVAAMSALSAGLVPDAFPVAYHKLLAPLLRNHREQKCMPVSEWALQYRLLQIRPDLITKTVF